MTASPAAALPNSVRLSRPWIGGALLGMLGTLALRVWVGRDLPLWLDESWTGMIATQPDQHAFWREAWLDCNPPLYYGLMALWTKVAGSSDLALRLPSLICVTLAPLLPLWGRLPGLSAPARITWALLLALWGPGFEVAADARGYGLLYLLSVAQLLAFVALMIAPDRRRATLWAAFSALAGLTHYHALLGAGLQGLMLIWQHRARALTLWPAALAFVPTFGWLAIHAPRLADYARPDVAWYEAMTSDLAAGFVRYALGLTGAGIALVLIGLGIGAAWRHRSGRPSKAQDAIRVWQVAAMISLLGLGVELGLSSLKPMLTDRYLVPLVPSLLLGLVLLVQHWLRGVGLAALVALYAGMLHPAEDRAKLIAKTRYGFAPASAFIAEQNPRRLIFVWDHPAAHILDPGSVSKLGGFFLARAGHALPVAAVTLSPRDDANRRLPAVAGDTGGIIWIYNRARASSARQNPPRPSAWAGRHCLWSPGRWVGTLACGPVRLPKAPH